MVHTSRPPQRTARRPSTSTVFFFGSPAKTLIHRRQINYPIPSSHPTPNHPRVCCRRGKLATMQFCSRPRTSTAVMDVGHVGAGRRNQSRAGGSIITLYTYGGSCGVVTRIAWLDSAIRGPQACPEKRCNRRFVQLVLPREYPRKIWGVHVSHPPPPTVT